MLLTWLGEADTAGEANGSRAILRSLWARPSTSNGANSWSRSKPEVGGRGGGTPRSNTCCGGSMGCARGSETPCPLRGCITWCLWVLLGFHSVTSLLYVIVTYSACVPFYWQPKSFQHLSFQPLSISTPHPHQGGGGGLKGFGLYILCFLQRTMWRCQRTSGISGSSGRLRAVLPHATEAAAASEQPGPPLQPSLFCHIGLFLPLLNRLNDRGGFF